MESSAMVEEGLYTGPDRRRPDPRSFDAYGDVMTPAEVAKVLCVNSELVLSWCRVGGLPHRHPPGSRKWLILKSEVVRWLRSDGGADDAEAGDSPSPLTARLERVGGRFVSSLSQLGPEFVAHVGYDERRGTYFAGVARAGDVDPVCEVGEDSMGEIPTVAVLERELRRWGGPTVDLDAEPGLRDALLAAGRVSASLEAPRRPRRWRRG